MRTHAASNIPCALVRSLPSVSGAALRAISSAPSCTKKNRAATKGIETVSRTIVDVLRDIYATI